MQNLELPSSLFDFFFYNNNKSLLKNVLAGLTKLSGVIQKGKNSLVPSVQNNCDKISSIK